MEKDHFHKTKKEGNMLDTEINELLRANREQNRALKRIFESLSSTDFSQTKKKEDQSNTRNRLGRLIAYFTGSNKT